jgi:ABC-2 type transport system permease protein
MTATARALAKLTVTELKLLLREPAAMFFLLAFPLLLLAFNGQGGNAPRADLGGKGPVDVLVPGYIAMILATGGLATMPGILAHYRESGVLRRLGATPLRPALVLVAHMLVQLVVSTAGLALLLAVGMLFYDLNLPSAPGWTVLAYLVGAVAVFAVGFVVAALAPSARTAEAAGFAIFFPMIFLAGAAVPREALSDTMRAIGEWLPLTHVVSALRDTWFGSAPGTLTLGVLAAIVVAGAVAGARTFRWE